MAEVFVARIKGAAGFEKLVAVKCLLDHLADDQEFVNMFLDEARLASNITSGHCVSILDLGRPEGGAPYIAMELVSGITVSQMLEWCMAEEIPTPVEVAVEILLQAARGLHDAHEAKTPDGQALNIVHRDVSPQNILVSTDGHVKLTDFGIAHAAMRLTRTETGQFKGKLAYCAPEQTEGRSIDRRADVFSLGVVAWEILANRRLFPSTHLASTVDSVRRMVIPRLDAVRRDVPEPVADVIMTALRRNLDDRWESTQVFARELREGARIAGLSPSEDAVAAWVEKAGASQLARLRRLVTAELSDTSGAPDQLPAWLTARPDDTKATKPTWSTASGRGRSTTISVVAAGVVLAAVAGMLWWSETQQAAPDPGTAQPPSAALPAPVVMPLQIAPPEVDAGPGVPSGSSRQPRSRAKRASSKRRVAQPVTEPPEQPPVPEQPIKARPNRGLITVEAFDRESDTEN